MRAHTHTHKVKAQPHPDNKGLEGTPQRLARAARTALDGDGIVGGVWTTPRRVDVRTLTPSMAMTRLTSAQWLGPKLWRSAVRFTPTSASLRQQTAARCPHRRAQPVPLARRRQWMRWDVNDAEQ